LSITLAGGLNCEPYGVVSFTLSISNFHTGIGPYAIGSNGLGIAGSAKGTHNQGGGFAHVDGSNILIWRLLTAGVYTPV
jgi:hypothetical protein